MGAMGCMNRFLQPTKKQIESKKDKMLAYITNKYSEEFEIVDFYPGKRSFNISGEFDALMLKSRYGISMVTHYLVDEDAVFNDNYVGTVCSYKAMTEYKISNINETVVQGITVFETVDCSVEDALGFTLGQLSEQGKIAAVCYVTVVFDKDPQKYLTNLFRQYRSLGAIETEKVLYQVLFAPGATRKDFYDKYVEQYSYFSIYYKQDTDNDLYARMRVSESKSIVSKTRQISFEEFSKQLIIVERKDGDA